RFKLQPSISSFDPSINSSFGSEILSIILGILDNSELVVGIDQIESQGAQEVVRYLFNICEYGEATVSSGAVEFTIRSNSILAFLANPIGSDQTKSFNSLIDHLSSNSAFDGELESFYTGRI